MRNAAETREKLLETATRLIWQSNYSCVGVNEICKQAGVTKGAFYHHFESKADLYVAASRHYWDFMKSDLDAIYSPSYTPLEQLENLIHLIKKQYAGESWIKGQVLNLAKRARKVAVKAYNFELGAREETLNKNRFQMAATFFKKALPYYQYQDPTPYSLYRVTECL